MSEDIDLTQLLTNDMPCRTLIEIERLDRPYALQISREVGSTFSHITKVTSKLESLELVRSEKDGRKKILALTEEGERVANAVEKLYDALEDVGGPE